MDNNTTSFIAIADYKAPAIPATKLLRKYWQKATALINPPRDKPFMPSDQLAHADEQALRHFFPSPSYHELYDELTATLSDHLDAEAPHPRFWLSIPEGDPGILVSWAEQHNYRVVQPPAREGQDAEHEASLRQISEEGGVLVIPTFEQWFLRQPRSVAELRRKMRLIEAHDGPVVISANGFALLFLQQIFDGTPLLAKAMTFRPYRSDRLYPWLFRNFYDGDTRTFVVKDSFSGKALFGETIAEPSPAKFVFNRLAADSRGIPWVAWQILTASLRTRKQVEDGDSTTEVRDGSAELWMHAPPSRREAVLHGKNARFVLHALAVHGRLSGEQLEQVIPCDLASINELCLEGFVHMVDGGFRINPLCYGAVFQALKSAGLSCPQL